MQFLLDKNTNEISAQAITSSYYVVKQAIDSTIFMFKGKLLESEHEGKCKRILEFIAVAIKKQIEKNPEDTCIQRHKIITSKILENGAFEYDQILNDLKQKNLITETTKNNKIYYVLNNLGNSD